MSTDPPADRAPPTLGNLPPAITSLVGRRRELSAVDGLIRVQRLVTLTGAGGIGKTTLALEVARRSTGRYSDGTWLVELAPLMTQQSLPSVVLASIAIPRRPGPTAMDSLIATLAERDVLLVLDNCEHLVAAAADLASTLLLQCPMVRILATSRAVLNVTGETTFGVPPMQRPEGAAVPTVAALKALDSVQLFLVRAAAARSGFELSERNSHAVAEICRRLDGIPLAIELAAARVRGLPISSIADRLSHQLDLLSSRSRTSAPRHRTLRATLDWSHDLLSGDEQHLFRQLAVFRGGFALDAANSICRGALGTAMQPDAADELEDLIDKSLVLLEEDAERPARYRLLEPVREYSESKLRAAGESESLAARHAAYYIDLADSMLRGQIDYAWFLRTATELDNLRAAFEWALHHDPHAALRLAMALKRHWMTLVGGEGAGWLNQALRASQVRDELRAEALRLLSVWSTFNGAFDEARNLASESLVIADELGSRVHHGYALMAMAILASAEAPEEWSPNALALYAEADATLRECGDRWTLALLLNSYGYTLYKAGDLQGAIARFKEGVAIADELDDPTLRSTLLGSFADAQLAVGDPQAAEASWNAQLVSACRTGALLHASEALTGLGRFAFDRGELERSVVLLGAATEFSRRVGARLFSPEAALVEEARHQARRELGEQRAVDAWARGTELSPEEAARFASEEPGGTGRLAGIRTSDDNHLLQEGDYWTLAFGGRVIRVKDSKGVRDLARLLSSPGTEIGCQELAFADVTRARSSRRGQPAEEPLAVEGGVGPVLDTAALADYRRRLLDLDAEIEDADAENNTELASQLRLEREFLLRELKAASGLGGRTRDSLDPAERARKAVTGRLRDAISHIELSHPELGKHLRYSVRTGAFCTYAPPSPTTWRVGPLYHGAR